MQNQNAARGLGLMDAIALGRAAAEGDMTEVRRLVEPLAPSPRPEISSALAAAAGHGHVEIVQLLLPFYEHGHNGSEALVNACAGGHAHIVEMILAFSNGDDAARALAQAAENGHVEIVGMLAGRWDKATHDSPALVKAAGAGHVEVCKTLMPHADLPGHGGKALVRAAAANHAPVVDLLMSRVSDLVSLNAAMASAITNSAKDCFDLLRDHCSAPDVQRLVQKQGADPLGLLAVLASQQSHRRLDLHTPPASRNMSDPRRL